MDELEKVINYIDKKEKVDSIKSDREKSTLKLIIALKKALSTENTNIYTCEHSLEDVCSYFDNTLKEKDKERVEETIFDCDSCFSTYNYLQTNIDSFTRETPEWLIEKVIEKDLTEEKVKKSIFSGLLKILKNPSAGLAIAGIAILITFMPVHQETMDKMDSISKPNSDLESSQVQINDKDLEKDNAPKVQDQKENLNANKELKNNTISSDVEKRKYSETEAKKAEKPLIKYLREKNELSKKQKALPAKIKENTPQVKGKLPETYTTMPESESIGKDNDVALSKKIEVGKLEQVKEREVLDEAKPVVPQAPSKVSEPEKLKTQEPINQSVESKNKINANESIQKEQRDDNPSVAGAAAPSMAKRALPNVVLNGKKVETMDKKDSLVETTRNININSIELQKDGFIVLYAYIDNSLGSVVGVSPLLKAGTYKNLVIPIKPTQELSKIKPIIYFDSNNNSLFDKEDLKLLELPMIEVKK